MKKGKLNKIQHEAARIATGTTKLVFIKALSKEIGWYALEPIKATQTCFTLQNVEQLLVVSCST